MNVTKVTDCAIGHEDGLDNHWRFFVALVSMVLAINCGSFYSQITLKYKLSTDLAKELERADNLEKNF